MAKTRKNRNRKKNRKTRFRKKRFVGGLQNSWRLPPHAIVTWRNLQEDEDAAPVVTTYGQTREDLDLFLDDNRNNRNNRNQKIENTASEYISTIENAKSSGREEI